MLDNSAKAQKQRIEQQQQQLTRQQQLIDRLIEEMEALKRQ